MRYKLNFELEGYTIEDGNFNNGFRRVFGWIYQVELVCSMSGWAGSENEIGLMRA